MTAREICTTIAVRSYHLEKLSSLNLFLQWLQIISLLPPPTLKQCHIQDELEGDLEEPLWPV